MRLALGFASGFAFMRIRIRKIKFQQKFGFVWIRISANPGIRINAKSCESQNLDSQNLQIILSCESMDLQNFHFANPESLRIQDSSNPCESWDSHGFALLRIQFWIRVDSQNCESMRIHWIRESVGFDANHVFCESLDSQNPGNNHFSFCISVLLSAFESKSHLVIRLANFYEFN